MSKQRIRGEMSETSGDGPSNGTVLGEANVSRTMKPKIRLLELPTELLVSIMKRIPLRETLLRLPLVCTQFRDLCQASCKILRRLTLLLPETSSLLINFYSEYLRPLLPLSDASHSSSMPLDFKTNYLRYGVYPDSALELSTITLEYGVPWLLAHFPNISRLQLISSQRERKNSHEHTTIVLALLQGWAPRLIALYLKIENTGGPNDHFYLSLFHLLDVHSMNLRILVVNDIMDGGHSIPSLDCPLLQRLTVFHLGCRVRYGGSLNEALQRYALHNESLKQLGLEFALPADDELTTLLADPSNRPLARKVTHLRIMLYQATIRKDVQYFSDLISSMPSLRALTIDLMPTTINDEDIFESYSQLVPLLASLLQEQGVNSNKKSTPRLNPIISLKLWINREIPEVDIQTPEHNIPLYEAPVNDAHQAIASLQLSTFPLPSSVRHLAVSFLNNELLTPDYAKAVFYVWRFSHIFPGLQNLSIQNLIFGLN